MSDDKILLGRMILCYMTPGIVVHMQWCILVSFPNPNPTNGENRAYFGALVYIDVNYAQIWP